MAESDLSLSELTDTAELDSIEFASSPSAWVETVLAHFDHFLSDHASCEKKASGMALSVAAHYPDQPELLSAMVDLAVEELNHYREVMRLLMTRGVTPMADQKDPYIHALNQTIRRGSENFLLDRLLVGAVVERRGAERFGLIAANVSDPELAKFYQAITNSEARHWHLFVNLAHTHCPGMQVNERLGELIELEGQIMLDQPIRAALH